MSNLRWRTKLFVLLTGFAVLPLIGVVYWVLADYENTHRESMLLSFEGLANAKANAIEQLTTERTQDVESIADLLAPQVVAVLEARDGNTPEQPLPPEQLPPLEDEQLQAPDPPTTTDAGVRPDAGTVDAGVEEGQVTPAANPDEEEISLDEATASLRHSLRLILWDQAKFEELLVIDSEGRVVASTFAEHEGRSARELEYFQGGRGATTLQGVFVSPITERWTMVISTPIRGPRSQGIGVLAARMNLTRLFSLIADTTGLGATGETVVTRVEDDEVQFMAPTRFDPDAVASRRMDASRDAARPSVQAALGQSGSAVYDDYRGRRVLSAWRPVPSLGWGVVVKMDEAEAMATASAVRVRALEVGAVILLLAVLASVLVSRELVRPLRQLKEATDRISRGDFGVQLSIKSADEIGELADSFERMLAAIKFFREHARTAEEEPIENEPEAQVEDERKE